MHWWAKDIQINYSRNCKAVKIQAGNIIITNKTKAFIKVSIEVSTMEFIIAFN